MDGGWIVGGSKDVQFVTGCEYAVGYWRVWLSLGEEIHHWSFEEDVQRKGHLSVA